MYFASRIRNRMIRRGSVALQGVIFGTAVGVGVAALAVDTGLMFNAKQELQNAADAAALAAASQLGSTQNPTSLAALEGVQFAALNEVAGVGATLDTNADVVFGHAVMNGEKFAFQANQQPYDAVQVTLRRDATAADGPVSLLFASSFGMDSAEITASATAMLVPRDIAVIIDLSASMNDDSELRHYTDFPSGSGGTRPGVQINLKDVWQALEATPPTWGNMTSWGDDIVLGSYDPTTDTGLLYIPRYSSCTSSTVSADLAARGYSAEEIDALMGTYYDNYSSSYRNRVKVILALAEWKSGKAGGKYGNGSGTGNGNNWIGSSELTAQVSFPYPAGSSPSRWSYYVNYVKGWTNMTSTDSSLRYRYGLKTVVNYLLESRPRHSQTPELAGTPEEPLQSVKNAVQSMIDVIIGLQTQDHVSLELFAQYGSHGLDLTIPSSPDQLQYVLQDIPDALNTYQAGHYTVYTNIGAGIQEAIHELSNGTDGLYNGGSPQSHSRARTAAAKVVIMLTDGKPNVNQWNSVVGNNHSQAVSWATDSADLAKSLGMTVYTIGVGADVNADMLLQIASSSEHYFFADNSPDPANGGLPMYVAQLEEIFQTLGGERPVRLIQ